MKSKYFTTKKLCLCAMFVAVSFALAWLEIPIFPPILKLDFSFAVMLIGGYMLGFFYAEVMVIAITLLCCLKTMTVGVGELANFLMAQPFVVLPALVYQFKKGFKSVIITLLLATILQIGVALICNRFIMFPLYVPVNPEGVFIEWFWEIVIFNVIKCVSNAIITILLYKRLKKVLHFFVK